MILPLPLRAYRPPTDLPGCRVLALRYGILNRYRETRHEIHQSPGFAPCIGTQAVHRQPLARFMARSPSVVSEYLRHIAFSSGNVDFELFRAWFTPHVFHFHPIGLKVFKFHSREVNSYVRIVVIGCITDFMHQAFFGIRVTPGSRQCPGPSQIRHHRPQRRPHKAGRYPPGNRAPRVAAGHA